MSHDILVHKVGPHESLDDILYSNYPIPSDKHLNALRALVGNLNSGHGYCSVSNCGADIYTEPEHNDFLLLPTNEDLNWHGYFDDKPDFSSYDFHGSCYNMKHVGHDKRLPMLQFQRHVNPVEAISYCEMIDGLCANLAEKKEFKWSEHFKDYLTEVSKETANKFAERGVEIIKLITKMETIAGAYGSSVEMKVRQPLKKEFLTLHKELNHLFPKVFKTYVAKNSTSTHSKSMISSNKWLDAADRSARNSGSHIAKTVVLKATSFNRYLKYMNVGEFFPTGLSLLAFAEAQYSALKAKKEGKDWQKTLFVKDSAVLGMMMGVEAASVIIPTSLPLVVIIILGAGISYGAEQMFESFSEGAFEKWLE